MHRKSLPVCVFLILTSMVSFLGCSFSASDSSAQAKDGVITQEQQAADADMVENGGTDADASDIEEVNIETARAIFKKSDDRSKSKSSPKITLLPARSAPLSRNVWFLRLPAH